MRRLLTLSLVFLPFFSFSQIMTGEWFVTGTAHFDRSKQEFLKQKKQTVVDGDLKLGFCFSNNFMVGAHFPYSFSFPPSGNDQHRLSYGPFIRMHFPVGESSIYLQGNTNSHIDFENGDFHSTDVNAGTGVHHFLSQNIAMNVGIEINFINRDRNDSSLETDTRGGTFVLGLEYFFNRRNNAPNKSKFSVPLEKRFLKKGNNFFGLSGDLNLGEASSLSLLWSKFYHDRFQLFYHFNYNTDQQVDLSRYLGNLEFGIGMQFYVPAGEHIYYAPKLNIGSWLAFPENPDLIDNHGFTTEISPLNLRFFVEQSLLEMGAVLYQANYIKSELKNQISGGARFGYEQFINDQVSLRTQLFINILKNEFLFDEPEPKRLNNGFHISFGFNYFLTQ